MRMYKNVQNKTRGLGNNALRGSDRDLGLRGTRPNWGQRGPSGAISVPPGPPGHWGIGNLWEAGKDPLGFLVQCVQEYGQIVYLRKFTSSIYLISNPDFIESVLVTNNQNFIKGATVRQGKRLLGNGLLASEGDYWRHQRRLVQPAFHRTQIASYAQIMVDYSERMLSTWNDGETRDIHQDMVRLTMEIVAKALFDADIACESEQTGKSLDIVIRQFVNRALLGFLIPENFPSPGNVRMRRAVGRLDAVIYRIIQEHRRGDADNGDLLAILLNARDEAGNSMTDRELRDEAMTLLLAGHETTAIALSWAWYLVSRHPEVEKSLWAELEENLGPNSPTFADLPRLPYTSWVIKETLRLYPPVWLFGRNALNSFELGGYTIPAGSAILMSPWVMHRDPRYFTDPECFRPERWSDNLEEHLPRFAYFPFGGGPRQCIGKSFALMEAALILATIAQRYRLVAVREDPLEIWPSVTLRPRVGPHMLVQLR